MNGLRVTPSRLHQWVEALWRTAGSSEKEARLTADHLVAANLSGHDSHGVGMLPRYVQALLVDELQLNQAPVTVLDHGSLLTLDAQRGLGQALAHAAMEQAIERAHEHGVCVLGLRHCHHLGRVGHWAEQAVRAGLASIHFTNVLSRPLVAPEGAAEARFSTNPFTVGLPGPEGEPLVLDFATSAIAMGKVRVAYNRGDEVPAGALIDADGRASRDPATMFAPADGRPGALLPAAAHKGYALSVVCEMLAGALTGGGSAHPANLTSQYGIYNNMLAIVFDPHRVGPQAPFEHEAREFAAWVRSARLRDGVDAILMPGEPERRSARARADGIPLDVETLAQLDAAERDVAAAFGDRHAPPPGPLSARTGGDRQASD